MGLGGALLLDLEEVTPPSLSGLVITAIRPIPVHLVKFSASFPPFGVVVVGVFYILSLVWHIPGWHQLRFEQCIIML